MTEYALLQVEETHLATYILPLDTQSSSDIIDLLEGSHQEIPVTSQVKNSQVTRIRVISQDEAYRLSSGEHKDMVNHFNQK